MRSLQDAIDDLRQHITSLEAVDHLCGFIIATLSLPKNQTELAECDAGVKLVEMVKKWSEMYASMKGEGETT